MSYPFKNPVSPTYQDVMSSNIGIPSSEMIDYDNTDKAINANKRIMELDNQIEELKQRIAERKALNTKNGVEMYDYVVGGDRSGLDAIKQRDMTLELSKKQKEGEDSYKLNDLAHKYELANTDYELSLQTFNPDDPKSIAEYKRKAQILNHYGSQLGFEPVSLEPPTSRPKTGVEEQIDYEGILKATLANKEWTDATRKKALDALSNIKDVSKYESYQTDIFNKGLTTEDKQRNLKKANEDWIKGGKKGNPDPKKYRVKFKDNKPDHLDYK